MTRYVINQVLPCLTSRPGEIVYVREIAADTGLDARQVAVAISNARRNHESLEREIEVIIAANAWRYRPPAAANGHVASPTRELRALTTPTTKPSAEPEPEPEPEPALERSSRGCRLFEEVHTSRDGKTIVRDELGNLYYVEEL